MQLFHQGAILGCFIGQTLEILEMLKGKTEKKLLPSDRSFVG
jgi:hypothetical protein